MACISRRTVISAASLGITGPLVIDDSASAAAAALIKTSKVPVGGGVIVASKNVVVTQPTRGKFRVFSSRCTHQGCAVTSVKAKKINCPCHGSKFSISTGAPVAGPAPSALAKRKFKVEGGKIYLT